MNSLTCGVASLMAQASPGGLTPEWTPAQSLRLLILIGILIVAVVALGLVVMVVRRRVLASENEMAGARSLMDQVREMHRRGEMSDAEYEATRKMLAAKLAGKVKGEGAGATTGGYAPQSQPRTSKTPVSRVPRASARIAPPGYDLTGDPLPGSPGTGE